MEDVDITEKDDNADEQFERDARLGDEPKRRGTAVMDEITIVANAMLFITAGTVINITYCIGQYQI